MQETKDIFTVMRKEVNDAFDDLAHILQKRRQKVKDLIQKEEDDALAKVAEVEKLRASMASYNRTIGHVVTSAPDDALQHMLKQRTSRLDEFQTRSRASGNFKVVKEITFDSQIQGRLKSDLNKFGE